jgi:peptidoglycan/xylan/chitin deacetylase (PgdA/CDA1 family)
MKIPILMYHQIDKPPKRGTALRGLIVAPSSFAWQMRLLRWMGYQGLSMRDLEPYLQGKKQGKVVGITFDDGYLNNLTDALPVLEKYQFSSTCYVVSQLLGKTNVWDQSVGIAQTPLMTVDQVQQWIAGGQEIGAHTRNHVHLPECSDEQSREEIVLCKAELEAVCRQPVLSFCYPYGQFGESHISMVRQTGYQTSTTTQRGRTRAGQDLFTLPRIPIVRSTTLPIFLIKLLSSYEDRK